MAPETHGGDFKPLKRKLLNDSDSDSDDEGGASLNPGFKVNEEYARRFEHNKKREEKHRLEEKFKKQGLDDESSSSDETEDDEGFLATEDLDAQISATLQAIRNKDPRVYDKNITFYKDEAKAADVTAPSDKKEKPVFLRDYQRQKLLSGDAGASDDEKDAPVSYDQEQQALQNKIVSEINAVRGDDEASSDEDDDAFMKKKAPAQLGANGLHPSRAGAVKAPELDLEVADKDPEVFLSNFMAARAWLPEGGSGAKWEAFESDEGEGVEGADEFEEAYNMRFEDPEKSNEVLKSYARDITAARSVRRSEKTRRQKQRDLEHERKAAEKQEHKEEKARLRKMKLDENEQRLKKIKQAVGATGKELTDAEWLQFLNDAWEDDKWEAEMNKRFGEEYYAVKEAKTASESESEEDEGKKKKKKKPKKPTWDDDIDIKDIVPDFEDEEAKPAVALTDNDDAMDEDDEADGERPAKKIKSSDHKRARAEAQKQARRERTKLEALVDSKLELTNHPLLNKKGNNDDEDNDGVPRFRYRETSPQSFGMTSRDILLAPSDQVLNDFAGLKKLATFRDEQKKRRDRKHLGKKARLRQWRRDVFGKEYERDGPDYGFERLMTDADLEERQHQQSGEARIIEPASDAARVTKSGEGEGGKKKRKRSKGKKTATATADAE